MHWNTWSKNDISKLLWQYIPNKLWSVSDKFDEMFKRFNLPIVNLFYILHYEKWRPHNTYYEIIRISYLQKSQNVGKKEEEEEVGTIEVKVSNLQ